MKKILSELKKNKLKHTPQRIAIIEFLKNTKTHPSAEEIFTEVSKKHTAISFATVYNTLAALKNTGKMQELTVDPEKKRFDMDVSSHHHFFCRVCKNIYDIYAGLPIGANFEIAEAHTVENFSLNFTGICRNCKETI